jgi:hypothetical protein
MIKNINACTFSFSPIMLLTFYKYQQLIIVGDIKIHMLISQIDFIFQNVRYMFRAKWYIMLNKKGIGAKHQWRPSKKCCK